MGKHIEWDKQEDVCAKSLQWPAKAQIKREKIRRCIQRQMLRDAVPGSQEKNKKKEKEYLNRRKGGATTTETTAKEEGAAAQWQEDEEGSGVRRCKKQRRADICWGSGKIPHGCRPEGSLRCTDQRAMHGISKVRGNEKRVTVEIRNHDDLMEPEEVEVVAFRSALATPDKSRSVNLLNSNKHKLKLSFVTLS